MVHGALIGARDLATPLAQQLRREVNTLTRDEQLARYVQEHKGNPAAMAAFAARFAPRGSDPLAAARQYERVMEQQLKIRN